MATESQHYCANCRVAVSGRGPAPASGNRYCRAPDCRAAKQREDYAATRAAYSSKDQAPTECSCCGEPLPARPAGRGDSPLGRWCRRARCQRHRRIVEEGSRKVNGVPVAAAAAEHPLSERDYLFIKLWPVNEFVCPTCGVQTIKTYSHPLPDTIVLCKGPEGTYGSPPHPTVARWAWPHLIPLIPATAL